MLYSSTRLSRFQVSTQKQWHMEEGDIQLRICRGNTCVIGRTGEIGGHCVISREAADYFVSMVYLMGKGGREQ